MTSLIQTFLWVGLIGIIFYRYHEQIQALLEAVQKRIQSGSGIKAGMFEIQPQAPEQQKRKFDQEIREATGRNSSTSEESPEASAHFRARYFQAEDLALRAIQSEYGVAINRQVRLGQFMLDGLFAKDGTGHIVEIKFRKRPSSADEIREIADRIFAATNRFQWRNIRIIIALVYDSDSIDLDKEEERLIKAVEAFGGYVDLRCYSLKQLEQQFGILPG
jgi:hypothetical protein